jgi:hypothetical protein
MSLKGTNLALLDVTFSWLLTKGPGGFDSHILPPPHIPFGFLSVTMFFDIRFTRSLLYVPIR